MEEPTQLLSLLIRAAAEGIISESKAASLANMSLAEFREHMQ
jgi:predicted HTH domain antitoxin